MQTSAVFKSSGKDIRVQVYKPTGTQNGGVIVVAYGSDGMIDNQNGPWKTTIEGYASDLATRGFVTVIPHYFDSTGTLPGQLDVRNIQDYLQQVARNRPLWQQAISDSVTYFTNPTVSPGVDRSRVGLLGFSLGGYLCARLSGVAKALTVFFAPYMDGLGLSAPLRLHAEIHHGGKDPLLYSYNATRVHRELEEKHASSKLWPPYEGAVHGFVGTDPNNTNARTQSKARTIEFFEKYL